MKNKKLFKEDGPVGVTQVSNVTTGKRDVFGSKTKHTNVEKDEKNWYEQLFELHDYEE